MKLTILMLALCAMRVLSFTWFSKPDFQEKPLQQQNKVGDDLKYNGKGFDIALQNVLTEVINDAAIFYKGNYFSQAKYISDKMKATKPGLWHVIIFKDLNISKITEVSTGFYYWSDIDTWALWYNASTFTPFALHLVIYNGPGDLAVDQVSTVSKAKGASVGADLSQVIESIVQSLTTVQDIAKYIQKFDDQNRKWSVLSIPTFWGNKYPEGDAMLNSGGWWLSYSNFTKISGYDSSLIIYV